MILFTIRGIGNNNFKEEIMAEISKIVHCRVMKGLGPEWMDSDVFVFLDDIEPDTPESIIIDMVRADAKYQLQQAGFIQYSIGEIENN